MNYQYIEQLLDRYWNGETTLGEEEILRSFFCQDDVPAHLKAYSEFFTYTRVAKDLCVSDDFDSRFDEMFEIGQESKSEVRLKAIRVTFRQRLMPFIKAAAVVAVTLTIGGAAMKGLMQDEAFEYGSFSTGTYVQANEVQQVIETAQKTMTAKADSINGESGMLDVDVKTE